MECEECQSKNLSHKVIKTDYVYNDYFQEDIKIDTVKFKCMDCGYEWEDVF